jgi:hypothetical protein
MAPVPFSESVARVRDAIEKETGHYFDCCLINWYSDGDCAVSAVSSELNALHTQPLFLFYLHRSTFVHDLKPQ